MLTLFGCGSLQFDVIEFGHVTANSHTDAIDTAQAHLFI